MCAFEPSRVIAFAFFVWEESFLVGNISVQNRTLCNKMGDLEKMEKGREGRQEEKRSTTDFTDGTDKGGWPGK